MSILNVADEAGNIIGQDSRENIHSKGLLHWEVDVLFYTPKGEIIFQLRGKNKDTFPNLLSTTVGGHVELGDNVIKTALKEMREETGIIAKENNLVFIDKVRLKMEDSVTSTTNNTIKAIYAFKFNGNLKDLKVEKDKAIGFEVFQIEKLINDLSEKEKQKFIPALVEPEFIEVYKKINNL